MHLQPPVKWCVMLLFDTSAAMKIQITESTKTHLDAVGGFHTMERGMVEVKVSELLVSSRAVYIYGYMGPYMILMKKYSFP